MTLINIAPPGPAADMAEAGGRSAPQPAEPPQSPALAEQADQPVQPPIEWKVRSIRVAAAPAAALAGVANAAGAGSGRGGGSGNGSAGGASGHYDPYAGAALMRRDDVFASASNAVIAAAIDPVAAFLQQRLRESFPQVHGMIRLRLTIGYRNRITNAVCERFTIQAAVVPRLLASLQGLGLPANRQDSHSVELSL